MLLTDSSEDGRRYSSSKVIFFLDYWMMDKVQNSNNTGWNTTLSEPFTISISCSFICFTFSSWLFWNTIRQWEILYAKAKFKHSNPTYFTFWKHVADGLHPTASNKYINVVVIDKHKDVVQQKINKIMKQLETWFQVNNLLINIKKTVAMSLQLSKIGL
jgi:hypothetical protein